jgi:hypothetical protein
MNRLLNACIVMTLYVSAGILSAAGLTNRADWSWNDQSGLRLWTDSTQTVTNMYKFQILTPGFDPSNRYPIAGETIHIPFTIQNIGGEPMSVFDVMAGFSGSWFSNWSLSLNLGNPAVFEPGDTAPYAFVPLAPGDPLYLWVNITFATGLAPGTYSFVLTNQSGDWPYTEIITNHMDVYLQNVTVLSAYDGGHVIRSFDGTGFLGDRDVTVAVRLGAPASDVRIYYDVGKDPTGLPPDGSLTNNRQVPFAKVGGVWRAVIPSSDPEIVEGNQVRFIVVVDGRVFKDISGGPFAYGVDHYAPQPAEQDGPLILTSNAGDFTTEPVRFLYDLPTAGHVNITVFNLRGELIRLVRNERLDEGQQADLWDGRNDAGREVSQGLYFVSFHAPGLKTVRKVLFVKR